LNLALGLILALGAGAGAVVLAELLETGVFSSADVEKRFKIRYLGAIPSLASVANGSKLSPVDYITANPFSGFAEAFRGLRSAIVHGSEGPVKVVVVTSSLPEEGKTTTAVCLGRLAALQGAKVVIVDCDLRRRSMQGALDAKPRSGLLEVLEGEASLEEAVVHDADTGADILPLASERITPKDVFGGVEFDRLLAKLTSAYDLILLDTPPVLAVSDSRVLARKADFVLFVARWKKTPAPAIHGALRLLAASNVGVSGIVLNQFDINANAVSYDEPSAFFPSYRQYYLESSE
jgi:capsular exopolysaccharide synthesis family protein